MAFESFYAATEGQPPSSLALEAVAAVGAPGGRAIDIGSGAARDAVFLAQSGFETEAIDPNPAASAPEMPGLTFLREDAKTFERPAESYRLVLCNKVLPFVDGPGEIETVLAKIRKILASDGVAAFSLFGERDDWKNSAGVRTFTSGEAAGAIAAAGLRVTRFWEEEFEMAAAGATRPKHWHVFRYLATPTDR